MKNIELHPTVLVRTPAFSYSEGLDLHWDALKNAIKESSPEFYNVIREMTYEQLQNAEPRIQISIRKYYNRAAFRSTPYGRFASVSSASLLPGEQQPITLSEHQTIHQFTDWSERPKDAQTVGALKQSDGLLFSNTTFYRLQDEIRYVQNSEDKLILSALDFDRVVFEILETCSVPQKYDQLSAVLSHLDKENLRAYVDGMLELGLLFTSEDVNIIGQDYFRRTGKQSEQAEKQYLITERKVLHGVLDKRLFRHLPELAMKLLTIIPQRKMPELEEFKARFFQRFEQAEVPVMVALDPDAGIGYGELSMNVDQPQFAKVFASTATTNEAYQSQHLKEVLYRQILLKSGMGGPINLEDILGDKAQVHPLPNSFSAVCSLVDSEIFLEILGGATATALPGRFGLAIPAVHMQCRDIARTEQEANPSVLFFDIGYTKEDHVDNINRRPSIYDLHLSILNFDTSVSPLPIHDILISVQRGEVVLRSKKYDKRLVPRFASSYNYRRSDLPLYRLLMDIQSQGLSINLSLKPMLLVPGLPYYPRVQFKNIVVSPASWQLSIKVLEWVADPKKRSKALQASLRSMLPCTYIKTGKGDQTLCLSIDSISDMEMLLSLLEKERELYVEEAYIPVCPAVRDTANKPFLPQIILTLLHHEEILAPLPYSLSTTPSVENQDWIGPGKQWLYFELFCSPFRADFLFQARIATFITANKNKISSWFFIRYAENGHHIRLRLRLRENKYGYQLMSELTDLLDKDLQAGIISEIKVKTYKREVHRYSSRLMGKVEEHFCRDSKFVFAQLPLALSDMKKYRLCTDILDSIASSDALSPQAFERVIKNIAVSMNNEHNIAVAGFKELNKIYGDFLKEGLPDLSRKAGTSHVALKNSFVKMLADCDAFNRPALMADLMHMHINRLFATDQRKHETVLYNFYALLLKRKTMHMEHVLEERA